MSCAAPRNKRCLISISCLLVFFSGLFVFEILSMLNHDHRMDDNGCGTTPAEARKHGCRFEAMQRAWIPSRCFFPEPASEYDPFGDRLWFLDSHLSLPADPTLLREGEYPTLYVANFHQEHCTYNWRKLALATSARRKWVDSRVANLHHATHCATGLAEQTRNMTAQPRNSSGSYTRSNLNYLTCVSLF